MWLTVAPSLGCSRSYDVGDHVLVEWEGKEYPAMIIEVPGPGRVKVHYDGYDELWDETIPRSRVKGRVTGPVAPVEPPAKVRRTAAAATPSAARWTPAPCIRTRPRRTRTPAHPRRRSPRSLAHRQPRRQRQQPPPRCR